MIPWAVLITGAVGVGGTALGAWLNGRTQTKTLRLSLDAENERARLADKRRIYATCLARLEAHRTAAIDLADEQKHSSDKPADNEESQETKLRLEKTDEALTQAVTELFLIAPQHVFDPAVKVLEAVKEITNDPSKSEDQGEDYIHKQAYLTSAMRADLGETEIATE
jgi:hypothetical protein